MESIFFFDDIVRPVLDQTNMGDIPRKTLLNSLQLALLSSADIAFSVQGRLSHLITQVVPVVHVLHLKGADINRPKLSYACQSQHQGIDALMVYESRTALARRFQHNYMSMLCLCLKCFTFPQ